MNKKEELKAHIIKCCVDSNMTIKQTLKKFGVPESIYMDCVKLFDILNIKTIINVI